MKRSTRTSSVVALGIGIGMATAVVTVANALLLRPLPVTRESELAVLHGATRDGQFPNVPLTLAEVTQFQGQSSAVTGLAYHTFRGAGREVFRADNRPLQIDIAQVSGNWFDVLGARAALGTAFRSEDDMRGRSPVLVLSHRAWQRHFAGDSGVIGRRITVAANGQPLEVVGVMAAGMEYPRGTEAWTPLTAYSIANGTFDLTSNELNMVARLFPGTTLEQVREELTAFFSRLPTPAWRGEARGIVTSLREMILGDVRPAMRVVILAAATLLLIACFNAGNLLLLRTIDGTRDLQVRMALGASRSQIVRHQLVDSARLMVAAGIAGALIAVVLVKLFVTFAPPGLPRLDTIVVDLNVLAGAIGITVLTVAIAGIAPVVFATRISAGEALRASPKASMSSGARLTGELLVGTQVGLAVVALSVAALVTRSLANLTRTDLRFNAEELVAAELAVPADRLAGKVAYLDLHDRIESRLTSMPGVSSVAPVLSLPFIGAGGGIDGRVSRPDQGTEEAKRNPIVNMEIITPSYFVTIGTPVLQGRAFTEADRDGAPAVAIVSVSTARSLWPGEEPVGRRLTLGRRELDVVGVVPDTRYRDFRNDRPSVYFPLAQSFFPVAPTRLLVRTDGTTNPAPLIRQAVEDVDPGVTVASVVTLAKHMEGPIAQPRLNAIILAAFAVTALVLAAIGIFSVMSTMVRRRTREIGIRMALGATSREAGTLVVLRGLLIAALGTTAGIVVARGAGRLMTGLLYEIEASDIMTTALVASVVLLVAVIASAVPAKRAANVEPTVALGADV